MSSSEKGTEAWDMRVRLGRGDGLGTLDLIAQFHERDGQIEFGTLNFAALNSVDRRLRRLNAQRRKLVDDGLLREARLFELRNNGGRAVHAAILMHTCIDSKSCVHFRK